MTANYDGSNLPLPVSSSSRVPTTLILICVHSLATPSPEWEDLDDMLLCLAPPHTQHHFETPFSPASPDRIRNNAAFVEWRDHCGVQVLYIAEASSGPALEVACRLISAGRGNPFKEGEPALCFNVCFDTYYNNIPSMIASILAQSFAYREGKRGDVISKAIRNQHVFRKSSANSIHTSRLLRNLIELLARYWLESQVRTQPTRLLSGFTRSFIGTSITKL